MKKSWAVLAATAVAGGLALVGATSAEARYADPATSEGRYVGEIDWLEWGDHLEALTYADDGTGRMVAPATSSRTVAGQTLTTTCEVEQPANDVPISAYNPSAYGTGFDNLYNIGGADSTSTNTLVTGLMAASALAESNFSCTAALDGEEVPLSGLVFSELESNDSGSEYVSATPSGADADDATWRLIDGISANADGTSCDGLQTVTHDTATGELTLGFEVQGCTNGPNFVAFLDGATEADFEINGGGISAIALGVVLPVDFGDAPVSYGEAAALFSPSFSGGEVPEGVNDTNPNEFEYGTPVTDLRLGADIDADSVYWNHATAEGDLTGDDGVTLPTDPIPTRAGGSYTLEDVACSTAEDGTGFVSGWLDWNADGDFDAATESSDVRECTGSSVDLTWDVPEDAVPLFEDETASSFLRVRIAATSEAAADPTGLATSGEVEDYPVTLGVDPDPSMTLEKSAELQDSNGNGLADVGETINYSFVVTNTGNMVIRDLVVTDDKVTGITPETVAELYPAEMEDVPDDAPQGSVTFTADPYVVTTADLADGSVQNTASANGEVSSGTLETVEDTVETAGTPPAGAALPTAGAGAWTAAAMAAALAFATGVLALRHRRRAA
ncbi:MAG: CshA/CshB family fibrillar adhesin-related protein [Aeromicrobium sp.]|uniref:CshA/CshB family fibrillar adhesin-related protein n=1 Tax=Aeromicrobium sp. TaxID=1871063 RepID=UPI0039E451E0